MLFTQVLRVPFSSLFSLRRFSILCFAVCLINSVAVIPPPIDQSGFPYNYPIYLYRTIIDEGKPTRMEVPVLHIEDFTYFGHPTAPVLPESSKRIGIAHFSADMVNDNEFWVQTHEEFAEQISAPRHSYDYWRALDDVMERLWRKGAINNQAMLNWKRELYPDQKLIVLSTSKVVLGDIWTVLPSVHIGDQYFGKEPAVPVVPPDGRYIGVITATVTDEAWAATHEAFAKRFSVPAVPGPGPGPEVKGKAKAKAEPAPKPNARPYEGSVDYWRALNDMMQQLSVQGVITEDGEAMRNWEEELTSALTVKKGDPIHLVVYRSMGRGGKFTSEVGLLVGEAGKIISPDHETPITAENRQPMLQHVGEIAKEVHIDKLYAASKNEDQFRGDPKVVAVWKEKLAKPKGGGSVARDRFEEWKWADRLMGGALDIKAISRETQKTFDEGKTSSLKNLIHQIEVKKSAERTRRMREKEEMAGRSSQRNRSRAGTVGKKGGRSSA
ncbi:hypothetical protein FB446DRAFT_836899 [Lentinula raphanica]|nr:hypothetical protein FB446DRAFT_836899 [Lentinula raphanica]